MAVGGLPGAAVAAFAMFVPAALVVLAISVMNDRYREHPWRVLLLRTMIPVVLGLTWVGVVLLGHGALGSWETWAFMLFATGLMLWTRLNATLIILGAGAFGAVFLR